MIKFFRKIRQRFITENLPDRQAGKFSKYLLYALGEIVLVVIGILIAENLALTLKGRFSSYQLLNIILV